MSKKIRVLCVDDSALIRDILTQIIDSYDDMEVVAVAPDPLVARDLIKLHNPDVLTLDVEMPKMDGLDFLERLMRLRPMPVLMISSLTQKGSETTLRALELGAIDYIAKPDVGIRTAMAEYSAMIAEKIRIAARARPRQISVAPSPVSTLAKKPIFTSEKLVIIGASTGGTEAIRYLLERMPANSPAILITQHMPIGFTKSFAERLDKLCPMSVKEAENGERVMPGHVYIAPGNIHMKIMKCGANYVIALDDGEPVNRHKPSCDVLFQSASINVGKNAVGVILTGMGKDGAHGLLAMREAGAYTLAQNEETCVVFGMPKEAIAIDAADEVVSLDDMAETVISKLIASGLARRI